MSDETTAEMLAEIDRDLADIEKAVSVLQQQAAQSNYPQQVETTTDTLAEIEGQAADYTAPDGWRLLQVGETITLGDRWIRPDDRQAFDASRVGHSVSERMCYIRRMEQPEPEPEVENCGFEGKILREVSQPVQVREGRWKTRGGEIRNVILTPAEDLRAITYPWHDARHDQTWLSNGRYNTGHTESPLDLWEYLGPIQPEPEQTKTPDDVAAEALAGVWDETKATQEIAELQAQVKFLKGRELTLGTRLEEEKAVATKRLETIQELRSEVHHVQLLLGESRQRNKELEALVADLRTINDAQEKAVKAAGRENADLQHRLDVVSKEWAEQAATFNGLQQQLEAVKAELVQQAEASRRLQIELDAAQQVPQAVSDRFEEGWDAGSARAVETIAEWTEPFRTCGSQGLSYHVMQNLPHIMRTVTGLTPED